MTTNIYKKKSLPKFIITTTIKCFFLSVVFTIVAGFVLGVKYFNVVSNSMQPTMPVGTFIAVYKKPFKDVKPGDAITVNRGSVYLTHRVIGYQKDTNNLITAPEYVWLDTLNQTSIGHVEVNNGRAIVNGEELNVDTPVTENVYVGTVSFYIKDFGKILNIVKDNVIELTIGIILIVFVVSFI